jgi:hypothetical protein
MDCISVTWGFRDEPQLLNAGAGTLVHTPEELRDLLLRNSSAIGSQCHSDRSIG